jgi:hypothetical protein
MIIDKAEALHHLRPNSLWTLQANVLNWQDSKQTEPTVSEIDAEIIRLEAEYDANSYQRDRAIAFPTWQKQLDMQYHDLLYGTTTWKDAVAKVKSDNPKPE